MLEFNKLWSKAASKLNLFDSFIKRIYFAIKGKLVFVIQVSQAENGRRYKMQACSVSSPPPPDTPITGF